MDDRITKRLLSLRNSKLESKVKDLRTLLYDDTIYIMAYQNIYGNKGAFTVGIDKNDTLNNFNLDRIHRLIETIKNKTYNPNLVKRINLLKENGTARPLAISSGNDKLVQEAIKIILEAIYEPKFSDASHGFRKGRSCHTALKEVSTWLGTKWWIELDIKECFNNIDHDILISILEKRIDDQIFIGFIRKFLNAGYLENWIYHKTISGVPQGSGLSNILANIYINEFDHYIMIRCDQINSKKTKRNCNSEYVRRYNKKGSIKFNKAKLEKIKKYIEDNLDFKSLDPYILELFLSGIENRNLNTVYNRNKAYRIAREIAGELGLIPADIYLLFNINIIEKLIKELEDTFNSIKIDVNDEDFERLHYIRYADNLLLGYLGNKKNAENIYNEIVTYFTTELKFKINLEKSGIRFKSEEIRYLGYDISFPKYNINNKTTNIGPRNIVNPVFKVPTEKAINFVKKRGYGSYIENKSTHRSFLQNFDDMEILKQYNSELCGIWNYYKHAMNAKDIISKIQWLWQYSFLKTLGAKHKCSVAQIFKLGIVKIDRDISSGKKTWYIVAGDKRIEVFNLSSVDYVNITIANGTEYLNDQEFVWQINRRNSALRKLIANECEICGKTNTDTS